ncbi:hypothetical protein ADEAN_000917200 [Angomonas deanei]|uniref:Uncharacterized protein n=1 Tax=Angomonas deanei TaxID=59799 RepID=A0A7G2CPC4_9TRYP|nr:hypothetical protein ADEAN_000917200 [Angomonas deanei]
MTGEWLVASMGSSWLGKAVTAEVETSGKVVIVAYSAGVFLRVRLHDRKGKKVAGIDSYWNSEATVEYDVAQVGVSQFKLQVEGMMRTEGGGGKHQEPAKDRPFDIFVFTDQPCKVSQINYTVSPSAWPVPAQSTSGDLLRYPRLLEDGDMGLGIGDDTTWSDTDDDGPTAGGAARGLGEEGR